MSDERMRRLFAGRIAVFEIRCPSWAAEAQVHFRLLFAVSTGTAQMDGSAGTSHTRLSVLAAASIDVILLVSHNT